MFIANLPPHKHELKFKTDDYDKLWFQITRKRYEFSIFNQRFGFVDNQIMDASYHLPTNYVWLVSFWKILHIKEM
jgi:hypothetical protein